MPWPSWEEAVAASLFSLLAWIGLRRAWPSRRATAVSRGFQEFALMAALYAIWRLARLLPITQEDGALERARDIDRLQRAMHLPTEISVQHLILHQEWLARLINAYYAVVHVPALLIFLIWSFARHRDSYPHWRNALVAVTAGCLLIRFIRVAPPRFITELGFVDLSQQYGMGLYGAVGTGASDQFAAMPSIHVGWAAVVALGTFAMTRSRWRWLVVLHLPVTIFVVTATGHHWWLDGVVALLILGAGLALDAAIRKRGADRDQDAQVPDTSRVG